MEGPIVPLPNEIFIHYSLVNQKVNQKVNEKVNEKVIQELMN